MHVPHDKWSKHRILGVPEMYIQEVHLLSTEL
jgi:hypothetical protein